MKTLLALAALLLLGLPAGQSQTTISGNGPFTVAQFLEGSGAPSGLCTTTFNYGLLFWDHTNHNIWVCAANGYVEVSGGGGGGGGLQPLEDDVAYSANPIFNPNASLNTIVLTGNVTGSSLGAPTFNGFCTTFIVKQSSGTSYTFAWPANVEGPMPVGPGRNSQSFCYYGIEGKWVANGPGIALF